MSSGCFRRLESDRLATMYVSCVKWFRGEEKSIIIDLVALA